MKKTNLIFYVLLLYLTGCDSKKEIQNSHAETIKNVKGPIDSDKDAIPDAEEVLIGTNPYKADTDGDGTSDLIEISCKTNPLDPAEKVLKNEITGPIFKPTGKIIITSKNGVIEKNSSMFSYSSDYESEKRRLILKNADNLVMQRLREHHAEKRAEAANKKAGDERLDRMEKECDRLWEERTKNPSQVNEARYSQAYSEMLDLRSQLYPRSTPTSSGNSPRLLPFGSGNKLEDLEEKIDRLQDSVDEIDR